MHTWMHIISQDGTECGQINRQSFSAMIFAAQIAGIEIGGPAGVKLGEPVVLDTETAGSLVPVFAELVTTLRNSDRGLQDAASDVEQLLNVLRTHQGCTLLYGD